MDSKKGLYGEFDQEFFTASKGGFYKQFHRDSHWNSMRISHMDSVENSDEFQRDSLRKSKESQRDSISNLIRNPQGFFKKSVQNVIRILQGCYEESQGDSIRNSMKHL